MRYYLSIFLFAILSSGMTACASRPSTMNVSPAEVPVNAPPFMEYRIGSSDVLSIQVWQQPEMSRRVTVRPDGMISFPLLGELVVRNLTPLELRDLLVLGLSEYLDILPEEVSVEIEEIHSYTVSVLGEVNAAGKFEVMGPVSVLDMLAQAGGMTEFAASSRILILRNAQGGMQRIPFDYNGMLSSSLSEDHLWIYPGDIIVVP